MQADILAFIINDVNFYLWRRAAFGGLYVGPYDIVRFTGRNPLGEFAVVVGVQLLFGFLFVSAPDLDRHAMNRAVIGAVDGAKDQRVGLLFKLALGRRLALARVAFAARLGQCLRKMR